MPNDARNWISRLSRACRTYSPEQLASGCRLETPQMSARVKLALRIVAMRSELLATKPQALPRPEKTKTTPPTKTSPRPAPTVTDMPADEPAEETAIPVPEIEPPARPSKTKKASFSAVSLDDAAGLLSAFGALTDPSEPTAPAQPAEENTHPGESKEIAKKTP